MAGKFLLEGQKEGYHGAVSVTPVTIPSTSRVEIPGTTSSGQLLRRKSILVQNNSASDVFIGGNSVGYGAGFGGGDSTTCSGITVGSGISFSCDVGRARVYAFNPSGSDVVIKVVEIS